MAANPSGQSEKIGIGSASRCDLLPEGSGGLSTDLEVHGLTGESFAGIFAGAGTLDLSNLDLSLRIELQTAYVTGDTSPVTVTYTDGRTGTYYPLADVASTEDKIVTFIWYGPVIKGTTTRQVIVGRGFISGTTGDGASSPNTPLPSNIQLFPAPSSDAVTIPIADFDAAFVTAADVVIPANKSCFESHMALPA